MLYAITTYDGILIDVVEGHARQAMATAWLKGPRAVVYDGSESQLALLPRAPELRHANPYEESRRDLDQLDPAKAPAASHRAMGGLVIGESDVRQLSNDEAYAAVFPYFKDLRLNHGPFAGRLSPCWTTPAGMIENLLRQNHKTEKSHPQGAAEVLGLSLLPARMWGRALNGDEWLSEETGSRKRGHNFCIAASEWCEEACLVYSGRQQVDRYNTELKEATIDAFLAEPVAFSRLLWSACRRHQGSSPSAGSPRTRSAAGTVPFIRLNVLSDIPWELVFPSLFGELIPPKNDDEFGLWFYDYTKVPGRIGSDAVPANYDLTFSFSGANLRSSEQVLDAGGKVAVVFFKRPQQGAGQWSSHDYWRGRRPGVAAGPFPARFLGAEVIDGDVSDVRPYDELLANGDGPYIVGLRYKAPHGQPDFDPVTALFVVPCWDIDGEIVTVEVPRDTPGTLAAVMDRAELESRGKAAQYCAPERDRSGEAIIPATRLMAAKKLRNPGETTTSPRLMPDVERYCQGYCAEFAIALNEVFGYELAAIEQVDEDGFPDGMMHVFALHPTDPTLIIDARGARRRSALRLPPVDPGVELREESYTPEQVMGMWATRESDEVVGEAMDLIQKHRGRYSATAEAKRRLIDL